jgi:hypothetical protein
MQKLNLRFLVMIVGLICVSSFRANADAINFTLISPTQTGVIGAAPVTFTGVLTNPNATDVFLNGDNFSLGLGPSLDDTSFILSAPVFLAANGQPGDTTGILDLFSLTLSTNLSPGSYSGTFYILGGSDSSAFNVLATQAFTVNAVPRTSQVPEPSTICLLGTAAFAVLIRKKRLT